MACVLYISSINVVNTVKEILNMIFIYRFCFSYILFFIKTTKAVLSISCILSCFPVCVNAACFVCLTHYSLYLFLWFCYIYTILKVLEYQPLFVCLASEILRFASIKYAPAIAKISKSYFYVKELEILFPTKIKFLTFDHSKRTVSGV